MPDQHARIVLQTDDSFENYTLTSGLPLTIMPDFETRYCVGWHDIATHTKHPCDTQAIVDTKYESCFACRKKTDFNPAFYNTSTLSAKQADYNNAPHSVYVAYFGGGLAKAGITSDSRGLQRIYEQGALLYAVVASCPDATVAHNLEDRLIQSGLKNSVTKKQKSDALLRPFDVTHEQDRFQKILARLDYADADIHANLNHFFYDNYPKEPVVALGDNPISGYVIGVVGRYLILENNSVLYGYWLSKLSGYYASFDNKVQPIDHQPIQASLF
jgi:hypothetical protein